MELLRCYFDETSSSRSNTKCGIPQGSCMGPLLCMLYYNDFENCMESIVPKMYANDTCVNTSSENLNELLTALKNEMENISNWMRLNTLRLNASKSEYIAMAISGGFRGRGARGRKHLRGPCLKVPVLLRMWLICFDF